MFSTVYTCTYTVVHTICNILYCPLCSVSAVVKTMHMSGLSQSGKGKAPAILEVQEQLGNCEVHGVKSARVANILVSKK